MAATPSARRPADPLSAFGQVVGMAAANVGERVFRGSLADLRPAPHTVLLDEPQCRVLRFAPAGRRKAAAAPIVLVPPIGAPAKVYDLRRGCSMAHELAAGGFPVYVLDYGRIGFADRGLSIPDLVDRIARAVEVASKDQDGRKVVLAGWCAGGVFSALYVASRPARTSRVAGLALLASPLDVRQGHPLYPIAASSLMTRAMGIAGRTGVPAFFVSQAFKWTSPGKQLLKPVTVLRSLHKREKLAHMEAVDSYINGFAAYPGVAGNQLLRWLIDGDLADGRVRIHGRRADPRSIRIPTLVVAGKGDGLAPAACVEAWTKVLVDTEFHLVPGGHLGVVASNRSRATTWKFLAEFSARVGTASAARPRRAARRAVRPAVQVAGAA